MLTGQYAHNHGVLGNDASSFPLGDYAGFTSDSNTVATWLHDAGYQTAFVSKYLTGRRQPRPGRPRDGMSGTPAEAAATPTSSCSRMA